MSPKLITTFAAALLVIFLVIFLIAPKFQDAQNARNVISEQREIIQSITDRVNSVKNEIKKYEALGREDTERILRAVPEGVDTPNLIFNLETISSSSGLVLESMSISERATDVQQVASAGASSDPGGIAPRFLGSMDSAGGMPDVLEARVDMSVRGSYESFKDFLKELENSLRLFDMETITFSSPGASGEGESNNIRFNLVFRTYYVSN